MYGVENEAREEIVWFAPASAHEVIQSQQLKNGSEIIVKLIGKTRLRFRYLAKRLNRNTLKIDA